MRRRRLVVAALYLFVGLCLIFGIWGVRKAIQEWQIVDAMYRPARRPRKAFLDIDRLAAFRPQVVPVLCMAIAERWHQDPTPARPSGDIPSWAQALGHTGDSRAIPTLIALADHHDWLVREWAAVAMAESGDERCLPALRRLSQDNNESVAIMARIAIEAVQTRGAPQEDKF